MDHLQILTESFKTKYESFITGCDSLELAEKWNKAEYGEMDVFYENELLSVALSLIAADGNVGAGEVRFLNESFGFSCTEETLREVFDTLGEEINGYFEAHFKAGWAMLRGVNEKLADAYKELFGLICDIIAASDGVIAEVEKEKLSLLVLE